MKIKNILILSAFIVITGCSSKSSPSSMNLNANNQVTPQQHLNQIQNDPKMPDGLKKIQEESLQHQPGVTH